MKAKKWICMVTTLALLASAVDFGGAAALAAQDESAAESEAAPEGTEAAPAESETIAPESEAVAAPAEEIPAEDISVTWEKSRVYMELTLGRYSEIATYGVKGYEDVPFLKVSDYMELLFEGRQRVAWEDGVLTVLVNGTKAEVDPAADTLFVEDPARFSSNGKIPGAVIEDDEFNVITASSKHESTRTEGTPLLVSLEAYHMPVIAYEDDILMPFLALQSTFGCLAGKHVLAYNGRDYYNAFEAAFFAVDPQHTGAKESPYMKAITSGPFSEKTETTKAYAEYGYYAICLLLDLSFGHKEERNITTFDEYFTRLHAKESMCSTDPGSAVTAEMMLFFYLFDSGHDAMVGFNNVFNAELKPLVSGAADMADEIKESEETRKYFEKEAEGAEESSWEVILGALAEKGLHVPEIVPQLAWGSYFDRTKPEDYGDRRLDFAGDTAVIYFNSFKDDTDSRKPSYYLDPVKEEDSEKSTFAFFYNCFAEIGKHEEVKNVVINLCDNDGGAAAALVCTLGFLSPDGEVDLTILDTMTQSYREERYHVDTNLDGIADEKDGFGGQYGFYILTSGSSYSCGNALPYYAQKEGFAKIIGTKPGGGDCVVGYFIDAYGRCACYSSHKKLGTDDGSGFVSNENAVEPDLNMMPSVLDIKKVPWFDPEGIADAVHAYENGATEIRYDEKEPAEKISEFLIDLFGLAEEKNGETG